MKKLKIKFNWKLIVAFFAALIVALSMSMDFYLYDMVKENRIIIENIIDNEQENLIIK